MTRQIFTLLSPNLAHSFAHGQERISVFFHFGSILNWTIAPREASFGQKKARFPRENCPASRGQSFANFPEVFDEVYVGYRFLWLTQPSQHQPYTHHGI